MRRLHEAVHVRNSVGLPVACEGVAASATCRTSLFIVAATDMEQKPSHSSIPASVGDTKSRDLHRSLWITVAVKMLYLLCYLLRRDQADRHAD